MLGVYIGREATEVGVGNCISVDVRDGNRLGNEHTGFGTLEDYVRVRAYLRDYWRDPIRSTFISSGTARTAYESKIAALWVGRSKLVQLYSIPITMSESIFSFSEICMTDYKKTI